jgi:trigger factor
LPNSVNKSLFELSLVNIATQDVSETRKSLVVALEASEVAAEHQAVVAEFSRMARLPGFRPGKAPASIVQKRFHKEIDGEFRQKVVAKAYKSAIDESKLDVLTIVNVEEGTIAPDAAATVTVTVDIRPTFEMPEYTGIPTQVAPVEPTDEEVDRVIENLRSERADFRVADRASQKSDYVKLAYEGTVNGQPILELAPDKQIYGKVPQTWEEVEGQQEGLIPGLSQQIAGLKAGDKREVTITFPNDFAPVPALAGQTAVYAVEVQEVRERVLPPLDEEFFKANRSDNLEGLRTNVRNQIKAQKEMRNRSEQRRQVTEALLSRVDFPVPESMVENETQSVLRQFIDENMRRGVPAEQFEKDKKDIYDNARKAAATRVKSQLILARIAEQEKVQVGESDINAFIYRESMRSGQPADKLVKTLTKDRDQLRSVQQSIIFDKTLDLLVTKASVTESPAQA